MMIKKYYSWSILACDYFVDIGSIDMMEDLVKIIDSEYNGQEIWEQLEDNFIKKYSL